MDTQKQQLRIVGLLAIMLALAPAARADLTLIYTGTFDLPIPAQPDTGRAWMDDAVVEVLETFTVIDLDVEITLTHENIYDLQLFVQSPDGTRLTLNYYDPTAELAQDYTHTIFDDEADTPIELAHAPFTGRFKPKAPDELTIFDNRDPQGQWKIQIYDSWYAYTGTLEEAKLIFEVPEPTALPLLTLGLIFCNRKTWPYFGQTRLFQ